MLAVMVDKDRPKTSMPAAHPSIWAPFASYKRIRLIGHACLSTSQTGIAISGNLKFSSIGRNAQPSSY